MKMKQMKQGYHKNRRRRETELLEENHLTLMLDELWDMERDFSHSCGEHIATWLLQCWDNGDQSLDLVGKWNQMAGISF